MQARRIIIRLALAVFVLACLVLIAGIAIVRTDWFRNKVRGKIIAVAEQATGGRVEIGSFSYDWHTLTASVTPFALHGTEPAGDPPLFRAARIQVGLKIVSALQKRVDLASLVIDSPQVRIITTLEGRTNFPSPRIRTHRNKSFVQQLLDLRIRDLVLRDGFAEYNSRRIPLDVRAHNLDANFRYEAAGPRYAGAVASRAMVFDSGPLHGAAFQFASKMAIENARLRFEDTHLRMKQSSIDLAGALEDFASPHGLFDVKAELFPVEVAKSIKLPVENRGQVAFNGKAVFSSESGFQYSLDGRVTGRGLAFVNKYINVSGMALTSPFKLTRDRIELHGATVKALDGEFHGNADIRNLKTLVVDGTVQGFSIGELARAQGLQSGALSGTVTGPIRVESLLTATSLREAKVDAKAAIAPGTQGIPVQGFVDLHYEQAANTLNLANSIVNLGSSHAEVSGTLGRDLAVHATSRNLNDILAAFPLFGATPPKSLPIVLKGGSASFSGNITGPLNDPRFSGHAEATRFALDKQDVDHVTTTFDLTRSNVIAHSLELDQGGLHVQATGSLGLINWKYQDASAVSGKLTLRGADLRYDKTWGRFLTCPIKSSGGQVGNLPHTISATAEITGTVATPHAIAHLDASNVTAYGEQADRVHADITLAGKTLDITNAHIVAGKSQIDVNGVYTRQAEDWITGALRFEASTQNFPLAHLRQGLSGQAAGKAEGTARLVKGDFRLNTLNSQASVRDIALDGNPYGNLNLTATTEGTVLAIHASANLRGTPLEGSGEWKLEGDYPGHGEILIPRMTVAAIHQLFPNPTRPDLPFAGFVEGKIDISGPLKKTDQLKAGVQLSTVQINASQNARPRAGAQERDLVLRNSKPVVLEATMKNIDIQSAEFAGPETTLGAQGRMSLDSKNPWDLRVNGSINLAILQLFNPDLLASGNAIVATTIRGAFSEPDVGGRLELKNASLYMADLPNGLDQANGVIFFDRNRATVNRLSAVTGGGQISFQPGSFVGFRGPALLYRVQGSADHVRYRSPEGVSITVNAALSLIGTSENSVLSGTVTVMRAGFNPKTDVGSLLATTAKPVSTPTTPNQYLRGIQFDIRIESAQSLEIETSLTRNIEAEANIRVRGTPERPVVLGNLSVNEGEIEFFGSRYTINRGEVNFYNSAKIEPIIDMDLETSVRGVTVDITFSGALNKLNFSYRSDPPLQTNDIIALLAVGRAPNVAGDLGTSQTAASTNYLSTGSNALLGQAISAPVAGRLQRFFGVSHLKIDPQLTDLTSVPQARVTLEQQVSKDVTLTYITNLTRTQEQILRVEWDLSRQWSVIALRDENGAFGIDFQYRKRFK
ncbi:MAG: translocation/assembly module TamB domain-containing protein [Bryobacteraceae bacterium]